MPFQVPGIGYAGLGQQTAAAQLTFRKAMGGASRASGMRKSGRKKRAKRASTFRRPRRIPGKARTRRTRGASKGRLVKGSAAAKRYMAKIRKLRKR